MLKLSTSGEPAFKKLSTVIMAILLLVLICAAIDANIPASANSEQIFIEHVVSPGDTLWTIAKTYRPDADPREIVWEIQQASDTTALIRPGQVLRVPVR